MTNSSSFDWCARSKANKKQEISHNQLIEEEVEKIIKQRLLKDESGESLKKRLFPEDDQDDEEKLKALYQERLEKMIQANEMMKKMKVAEEEKNSLLEDHFECFCFHSITLVQKSPQLWIEI